MRIQSLVGLTLGVVILEFHGQLLLLVFQMGLGVRIRGQGQADDLMGSTKTKVIQAEPVQAISGSLLLLPLELLVIGKDGKLAWSNQVPVGECGLAHTSDPLPGRPLDDLDKTKSGR